MKRKSTRSRSRSRSRPPIVPDHLIVEQILPRLPVKTLIRFKSVCKFWHSTISSLEFQRNHLELSSACKNRSLIMEVSCCEEKSYGYFWSLDECSNLKECVKLETKYLCMNLPTNLYSCDVVGSCNGLVCLNDLNAHFFLWNPATNQCRNVFNPIDSDVYEAILYCGFGYVSSIDDYRIGCLLLRNEESCRVCIYSLKAGKWNTVATLDEDYHFITDKMVGSVINDIMYCPPDLYEWIGEGEPEPNHIDALNLVDGELKRIPLLFCTDGYYNDVKVFEIKGCLSLCMKSGNETNKAIVYDVWMLKQVDDFNSWEKVMSLRGEEPCSLIHIFETGECLKVQGSNKLMLHRPYPATPEQYDEGVVIWQSPEQSIIRNVREVVWGYVESLISPFGTLEYEDDSKTQD